MKDFLRHLPGYALRRASAGMLADLNARLEPLGVRYVEASILLLIEQNPSINLSKLGEALGIQRANMTPLIARLEVRGLIARAPIDGRSHGLRTSPSGAILVQQIVAAFEAHEQDLMARIPTAYHKAFKIALDALWIE